MISPVEIHHNLTLAKKKYLKNGLSEAYLFLKSLTDQYPHVVEYYSELGALSLKVNNLIDAELHFKQALKLDPRHLPTLRNYSILSVKRGFLKKAVSYSIAAMKIDKTSTTSIFNLAHQLHLLGRHQSAVTWYSYLLQIEPNNFDANFNLATIFLLKQEYELAIEYFKRALSINPRDASCFRQLSFIEVYDFSNEEVSLLKEILNDQSDMALNKANAGFALWRHYSKVDDRNKAFKALEIGNAYRLQGLENSSDYDLRTIDSIMRFCNVNKLTPISITENAKSPIFIVGMPRSGTSLVERIIATSKEVRAFGELNHLHAAMLEHFTSDRISIPLALESVRHDYLAKLPSFKEKLWTDKMPLNFMYVGFILAAFPNAKIIHVKREPGPTIWSNYSNYFSSDGNGFSYDIDKCARFYAHYLKIMKFWKVKYAGKILDVQYEDFVGHPKHNSRRIFAYLNIQWSPSALNFHKQDVITNTASFQQVTKPIYTNGYEEWLKYRRFVNRQTLNFIDNM